MSIPKEKTILLKIKEIQDKPYKKGYNYAKDWYEINELVRNYSDPGYIGGPIVGESEGEESTIHDLNQIQISTKEGKYLMAALVYITTTSMTDKTPYQAIDYLSRLVEKMYPLGESETEEV
jgi:hypothetical protein